MTIHLRLFWIFFKIGCLTFGGGLTMIPMIEREIVDKRGWFNKDDVIDIIAISQALPGVIAINIAVFSGYKIKGLTGALFALLGAVLPAFLSILGILLLFPNFFDNKYAQKLFTGIKIGMSAMLIVLVADMLKRNLNIFNFSLATIGCLGVAIFKTNAILLILFGIFIGLISVKWKLDK